MNQKMLKTINLILNLFAALLIAFCFIFICNNEYADKFAEFVKMTALQKDISYAVYWIIVLTFVPEFLIQFGKKNKWLSPLKYLGYSTSIPLLFYRLNEPLIHFITTVSYSAVIISILPIVLFEKILVLPYEIKRYLEITSVTILTILLIEPLNNWIVRFSSEEKPILKQKRELLVQLINRDRVSVAFYSIYFCLLLWYNLTSHDPKPKTIDLQFKSALINSFSTFLAFDRIFMNWKRIKYDLRNFVKKYAQILSEKYQIKDARQTDEIDRTVCEHPKFP